MDQNVILLQLPEGTGRQYYHRNPATSFSKNSGDDDGGHVGSVIGPDPALLGGGDASDGSHSLLPTHLAMLSASCSYPNHNPHDNNSPTSDDEWNGQDYQNDDFSLHDFLPRGLCIEQCDDDDGTDSSDADEDIIPHYDLSIPTPPPQPVSLRYNMHLSSPPPLCAHPSKRMLSHQQNLRSLIWKVTLLQHVYQLLPHIPRAPPSTLPPIIHSTSSLHLHLIASLGHYHASGLHLSSLKSLFKALLPLLMTTSKGFKVFVSKHPSIIHLNNNPLVK